MGLFGTAYAWRGEQKCPLFKICHTYPKMMKVRTVITPLKTTQKTSRDTHLEFRDIIKKTFFILRNTDIDCILIIIITIIIIIVISNYFYFV